MLGVLDLHFHQQHPEKILFQGPGFYFWVTTDYGKTFTAHSTPGDFTLGFWMELKMHPNVPEWLLAKVKRKDCLSDLSSAACAHDLFVSQVQYAHFLPHDFTNSPSCGASRRLAHVSPSSVHVQHAEPMVRSMDGTRTECLPCLTATLLVLYNHILSNVPTL